MIRAGIRLTPPRVPHAPAWLALLACGYGLGSSAVGQI